MTERSRIVVSGIRIQEPLKVVARGGFGTEELVRHVHENGDIPEADKEALTEVVDRGSENIMDLFHQGGVLTHEGKIHLTGTEEWKYMLHQERSEAMLKASSGGEVLHVYGGAKGSIGYMFPAGLERDLIYNVAGNSSLRFAVMTADGKSKPIANEMAALRRHFTTIPTSSSFRVESLTAVNQVLVDIANNFGRGKR